VSIRIKRPHRPWGRQLLSSTGGGYGY
jgi:hypothetical protein